MKKVRDKNGASEVQKKRRQILRDVLHSIAKKQDDERKLYSRQIDYDDAFKVLMSQGTPGGLSLVAPPYFPGRMYELYEQSAILKACVETYVDNVDGYGYSIGSVVADDDNLQKDNNPGVVSLKEFFDSPNDKESFDTIRSKLRRDYEVTGNSFIEVVRGRDGKPTLLFWADAKRIRLTVTRDPVICDVQVPRGGSIVSLQAEKRFRSYCMLSGDGSSSGSKVRYFKEYGDPRSMDCTTGNFVGEGEKIPPEKEASELIHFKHGNDTYGVPRWIASLLSVLGSWKANMVNYDLFDNQGIPPLIITVAGGMLTDESFTDLVNLFRGAKGSRNFNRLLVLEAESNGATIDGKEAIPKLEIQDMTEYRKEDAMFLKYLEQCNQEVQKLGFRLPGMFLGISDDANYATAFIVRKTAEEQIFIPERTRFDETINKTLVRDLVDQGTDLCFRSNGPMLQSVEDLPQIISVLVNSGAFTVNGLISFVNDQFGLKIALYEKEKWADEPIQKNFMKKEREEEEEEYEAESDTPVDEEIMKNQRIYKAIREIEKTVSTFGSREAGCHAA